MPELIVENGTGIPNANSYIDLDYFYDFADQFIDTSVYTEEELVRKILTSHFMFNNRYENLLLGTKYFIDPLSPNYNKKLLFPRTVMEDSTGNIVCPELIVPEDIKEVIAILTIQNLTEPTFDEEVVSFNAVQIPKLVSVTASNTLVNNENTKKIELTIAVNKYMKKYLVEVYTPYIIERVRR